MYVIQLKHNKGRKAMCCQVCQNLLCFDKIFVMAKITATKLVLICNTFMYAVKRQTSLRTEALDLGGTPLIRAQASISTDENACLTGRSPGNKEVLKSTR